MWPVVLAQTTHSVLPEASGWVGAGLLGSVLGWLLMKHLPEKDAQIERMIERHRLELAQALTQQRADSLAALERILVQHDAHAKLLVQEFETLKQVVLSRRATRADRPS
jgi:hypothetical protein